MFMIFALKYEENFFAQVLDSVSASFWDKIRLKLLDSQFIIYPCSASVN